MRFELLLCVLGLVLTVIYFFADPGTYEVAQTSWARVPLVIEGGFEVGW